MTKFTRIQRLLRLIPCVRGLALKHLKAVRQRQREAQWTYAQSVLVGVGNLIFSWSFIERQLNTVICQYHHHASARMKKHGLPDSIGAKITYLVEVGRDERVPESLRKAINDWIPQLNRLRHHRHLIAHGTIFQRNRNSTEWYVQDLTLRGDTPTFREEFFTNEQLNEKSREIHELSHRMALVLNPIIFGESWTQ